MAERTCRVFRESVFKELRRKGLFELSFLLPCANSTTAPATEQKAREQHDRARQKTIAPGLPRTNKTMDSYMQCLE